MALSYSTTCCSRRRWTRCSGEPPITQVAGTESVTLSGASLVLILWPVRWSAYEVLMDTLIDSIRAAFPTRPHIFNLGHGISPDTPIAHVEQLVTKVRQG